MTANAPTLELSDREKTVAENVDAKAPEPEPDGDPYGDIDFQSFDNYLNDSASRPRETEIFEKPSFENFLAKTPTLTDHLEWQLGLAHVETERPSGLPFDHRESQ